MSVYTAIIHSAQQSHRVSNMSEGTQYKHKMLDRLLFEKEAFWLNNVCLKTIKPMYAIAFMPIK
ncbi:hypothetical protein Psyaliredsea_02270 [Psychrobacter alimentarius]